MKLEIRLKTGFFETTTYYLAIQDKMLVFSPFLEEEQPEIKLWEKEILSVLLEEKLAQFEILTPYATLKGTIITENWEEAVSFFKNQLNIRLVCEYEGLKEARA